MTASSEANKIGVWHGALIGAIVASVGIFSGWLFVGKGWIEKSASDTQQIVVNTTRLDVIESGIKTKADRDVTRAEHEEAMSRIFRLESAAMQPCQKGKP
jgi:hypothetical protein